MKKKLSDCEWFIIGIMVMFIIVVLVGKWLWSQI
jgi:hypothetical protein